jgi:hypothetical protein
MQFRRMVLCSAAMAVALLSTLCVRAQDVDYDEDEPEIKARVSRISFIRGDVQIRRTGNTDWEKAALNLPIVEGDEIMTAAGERVEIQLNIHSHVRISENSFVRISTLQDGGAALSLSEGTMTVRLTEFDKNSAFFEIDAPKTTVAIQRAGMYRIDAGASTSDEVRVTVTRDGEARVYAEDSGFTLRSGRSATVKVAGTLSGEWDTAAASFVNDEFDMWSIGRDDLIAERIRKAHYDKYYDQDIYGAEELNDNGDWVHSRDYGYVWRPHRSVTARYSNWSPYRYGHWRWVPPYGWTWVNDEPWGWATYHHGRWIFDKGYWVWTPYGYLRRSRSWWAPALVGVTIIRSTVCWYPLPYGYGYYNYNYVFGGWGRGPRGGHHSGPRNGGWGNNNGPRGNAGSGGNNGSGGTGIVVPTPTPSSALTGQLGPSVFVDNESRRAWRATPPLQRVPPGAVVSTPLSSFGRDTGGVAAASPADARFVLSKALAQNDPVRILPTYQELDGRVSASIKSEKPRREIAATKPVGAAVRNADSGPLDGVLQTTKVLRDRTPVRPEAGGQTTGAEPRKTGAVTRPIIPAPTQDAPVRPEPRERTTKPVRSDPVRSEPIITRPSKPREERTPDPIRRENPVRVEAPQKTFRTEPDRPQRNDAPPRNEPVRSAPPRTEAPKKPDPPTKSEPVKAAPDKPAAVERMRDNR